MPFSHKFETIFTIQFFSKLSFFVLYSKLQNVLACINRVTNCAMPKIGWQSDLHGKMNPSLSDNFWNL